MDILGLAGNLWQALATGDMFSFARLLRAPEIWFVMAPIFIGLVVFTVLVLKNLPFIDRNLERFLMITLYLGMTLIIFAEVIRRSSATIGLPGIGDMQAWAGSSTVPAWIFLMLTWLGAAYSIKRRTQLNFNEVRSLFSRPWQLVMLGTDWFLWTGFAFIIFVVGIQRTVGSANNFQIIGGTDNMMQWWFYACIPAAWILLAARAWMVFAEDRANYHAGRPLLEQVSITETE